MQCQYFTSDSLSNLHSSAAAEPFSVNMLDCWLHLTVKVITFCHSTTIFPHVYVIMTLFKYDRTNQMDCCGSGRRAVIHQSEGHGLISDPCSLHVEMSLSWTPKWPWWLHFWWAVGTLHSSLSRQCMNVCMHGCKMTVVVKRFVWVVYNAAEWLIYDCNDSCTLTPTSH